MNIVPAQNSFTGGEITPLLRDRSDLDYHAKSVAIMRNMIVTPHGPATTRPGFGYKDEITAFGADKNAKVITYQRTASVYFILVFINAICHIWKNDNGVISQNTTPTIATPYTDAQVMNIHAVVDPSKAHMTLFCEGVAPYEVAATAAAVTAIAAGVYTAAPWTTNYPTTGCIFQQRMYMFNGENVWATIPSSRRDFTLGTGAVGDGFAAETDEEGSILWAHKAKNLVIGTEYAEHLVTSEQGIVHGSDAFIEQHSAYGSKNIQPYILGNKLTYIAQNGQKVLATQYDDQTITWEPEEMSFAAEHLFAAGITSFAWNQYPDYLGWFSMGDGELRIMTYDKMTQTVGWSQHQQQGTILSVASAEINGTGEAIIAAYRPESLTDIYIEVSGNQPMDSYIEISQAASTTVTGLDHLEGDEIDLIVDGAVHPKRTVVSGSVTLDYEGEEIVAGLSFTQELETLPLDNGSQMGSGRVHMKRFKDVFVGLISSAVPKINGTYPPDRNATTPMGDPEPLITGLVRISNLGWDRESPVNIKQELPLSLTVTGIFGKVAQDKL